TSAAKGQKQGREFIFKRRPLADGQQRATASPVNCSTLGRRLAATPIHENTTMLFLEISIP
ncbi:hypothetical protein Q6247_25970, partial [Klebsiella pneumoniae]